MKKAISILGCFVLLFACSSLGMAQGTTGAILGTVKDQTGAVVPGATVRIKHVATGTTRTVTTDAAGRYRAPGLALGQFEVTAEVSGFATEVRSGIEITIGREATVDFELRPGEVAERITVTGEAPLIETSNATVANLVTPEQITELPLNGRSFAELAIMQPGVAPARTQMRYLFAGMGTKLSIAGARPDVGSFLLDGLDLSNNTGTLPTGTSGLFMGVDTIAEFQVLTSTYNAQYGIAGAGVITAATKSGTNEIHGTVFEYLRNDKLDAKNFFDRPTLAIPPFRRNQFGFSLGGPIVKDRLFFFGGWEALRERLSITRVVPVPTVAARNGLLPDGPVEIPPGVRPFLNLYPLPTPGFRDFGDGRAEHQFSKVQPTRDDNFTAKVDYNLNDANSLFGRVTIDDSNTQQVDYSAEAEQSLPNFSGLLRFRSLYATVEDKVIFSPTVLNVLRLGYNRTVQKFDLKQLFEVTNDLVTLKEQVAKDADGQLMVPNIFVRQALGEPGTRQVGPRYEHLNLYHLQDTLHVSRGPHALKFGGEIRRVQFNTLAGVVGGTGGQWDFPNLRSFLEGRSRQLQFLEPGSNLTSYPRRSVFGFFVQDDWQVRPGLTMGLGLRYEPATTMKEKFGRVSTLVNPFTARELLDLKFGNPVERNRSLKNFAPRVGLAWDVFGDGTTSLRSGFGLSYALTPAQRNAKAMGGPPFRNFVLIPNPPFPDFTGGQRITPLLNPVGNIGGAVSSPPDGVPWTYVMNWSLEIQRQLSPSTVVTATYLGNRGVHVEGGHSFTNRPIPVIRPDGSYFYPAGAPRPNPSISGGVTVIANRLDSKYHGMILNLRRRISRGLQFQTSYTWSKAMDHDSDGGGTQYVNNVHLPEWRDPGMNWGPSNFDLRHNFGSNLSYEFPFAFNGIGGHLLNGWSTNYILSLTSGPPLGLKNGIARSRNGETNPAFGERPNIKPGFTHDDIVLGDPARYYDVSIFELQEEGTYGNLGRHVAEGPGFATFDFSVFKRFPVGETANVQFRAEFFNLFNHPNFQVPEPFIFTDASGAPNRTAGRIASTTSSSRQIQFGLKVTF